MEALRLRHPEDDDDGAAGGEEPAVSLALWIFSLRLGAAQALAYGYIYGHTLAVGRASFDVDMPELVRAFGRDRRTIDGWLAALEAPEAALIRTACDPLTGALRIACFRPTSFAPRRAAAAGRDPQTFLPGLEERAAEQAVETSAETAAEFSRREAPFVAPHGSVEPTDDSHRAAGDGTTPAPARGIAQAAANAASSGDLAQKPPQDPPRAAGDLAQKPPQDPPDAEREEILALQQLLERKRSEAFASRASSRFDRAQKPPARQLRARDLDLRSLVSVSVSETKTETRDLGSGVSAQKPPADKNPLAAPRGAAEHGAGYGAGLPLAALARLIQRDVGPALNRTVAHKVAAAVVDGRLDADEQVWPAILRAHDLVAAGRTPAAWMYFVGAMKAIFFEAGLPWAQRK